MAGARKDADRVGANAMSYQIGYGERPIVLADNRQVGEGRARMEQVWDLRIRGGCHTLTLANTDWPTCHLHRDADGV